MECAMTLYELLYGIEKSIEFYNGETIQINKKDTDCHIRDSTDLGYFSCVCEVEGKGLPYLDAEQGNLQRGNLYIHFRLFIPSTFSIDFQAEHQNFFKTYFNDVPEALKQYT
jgi:DnaJ-class molecular chaperone